MYVPPGSIIVEKAMGSTFTVKAHTCDTATFGCWEFGNLGFGFGTWDLGLGTLGIWDLGLGTSGPSGTGAGDSGLWDFGIWELIGFWEILGIGNWEQGAGGTGGWGAGGGLLGWGPGLGAAWGTGATGFRV